MNLKVSSKVGALRVKCTEMGSRLLMVMFLRAGKLTQMCSKSIVLGSGGVGWKGLGVLEEGF